MRMIGLLLVPGLLSGCDATDVGTPATPRKLKKTPDAAVVAKHMTPVQLALGDPVVNSIGMILD